MSKRIDTGGGESLGANPFDTLSSTGLPKAQKGSSGATSKKKPKAAPKKGRVELRREKSGRGGKTVTTLSDFATHLPLGELDKLAFDLKKSCACGGTLKGRTIELQGDVRDRAVAELEKRGFQPVRAGG
ncbi:translation initiation factor [Coraliomargarita sinensis]|uniref:Translation initiation factor n=1 Tax=Coraliomargarita sinensis TaxID=2174842 RepID=A0A317ZKH1_9BACT|nr:translation initiation factor [Coraliomargarita sinensis]PXA04448.1 translation initiation factor [Coraliomargarita sinensis]